MGTKIISSILDISPLACSTSLGTFPGNPKTIRPAQNEPTRAVFMLRDSQSTDPTPAGPAVGSDTACAACPGRHCTQAHLAETPGAPAGWSLAGLSFAFFLLPLLIALGGAAWAGPSPGRRLIAAIAGILLGMALAKIAVGIARAVRGLSSPPSPQPPIKESA